ncbi:MAG: hypothetical protein ACXAE3_16825 [Candidatus Kariarchaeaceae archaeon]|jgi:hypothetical protein
MEYPGKERPISFSFIQQALAVYRDHFQELMDFQDYRKTIAALLPEYSTFFDLIDLEDVIVYICRSKAKVSGTEPVSDFMEWQNLISRECRIKDYELFPLGDRVEEILDEISSYYPWIVGRIACQLSHEEGTEYLLGSFMKFTPYYRFLTLCSFLYSSELSSDPNPSQSMQLANYCIIELARLQPEDTGDLFVRKNVVAKTELEFLQGVVRKYELVGAIKDLEEIIDNDLFEISGEDLPRYILSRGVHREKEDIMKLIDLVPL